MTGLLNLHEPPPVIVERPAGRSRLFFSCDHASNRIPEALGNLGLPSDELERHIAWDIGAAGVARHLSRQLDATLVLQNYSRLVVDCNRPQDHEQLIPALSEATEIPGNQDLTLAHRAQRVSEIFMPYHESITTLLDERAENGRATAFVAVHSFTPSYLEQSRPWHIGILCRHDMRMADFLRKQLQTGSAWCIGENEPYQIDGKDYGIPMHAENRELPHVLIELRQDLIATETGQYEWAQLLTPILQASLVDLPCR
ncbi:MAG: putative N-formylglutamate amidohydrolase [Gammaproteobacteria bacterium]|jgi:predicted N-formylglutamate amidohydrolase